MSALSNRIDVLAEQLIEADAVGTFEDSNSGQAAARAAADLLLGWQTYDQPYQQAHAHEYQPYDVEEVIRQLRAWAAKGCPRPAGELC